MMCWRYGRACHRPQPEKQEHDTCSWCARCGMDCVDQADEIRTFFQEVQMWAAENRRTLDADLKAIEMLKAMQHFYTVEEYEYLQNAQEFYKRAME